MSCSCKNCAAGFWARYCVATRELSPAESARVEQIIARHEALALGSREQQPAKEGE